MDIVKVSLDDPDYPESLATIPGPPPKLYYKGAPLKALMDRPRVAIVGTRNMTPYGKKVTAKLAADLADQGVVIISGLAFGVDYWAHKTVLEAGGTAIAVLPGPVDNILPRSNQQVAQKIIGGGGCLVSEKAPGEQVFKQDFIARNRLVSGLAQAVLITEAREGSGTFHTFRFASEQGRHVFAVPGNIDSPASFGANNLLKEGAIVATSYKDIIFALGLVDHTTPIRQVKGRNPQEQVVLELLLKGVNEGEKLQEQSGLDIAQFNQVLTMLEIGGKIRPLGANQWAIA